MVFSLQQLAARGVGPRQIGENQGGPGADRWCQHCMMEWPVGHYGASWVAAGLPLPKLQAHWMSTQEYETLGFLSHAAAPVRQDGSL